MAPERGTSERKENRRDKGEGRRRELGESFHRGRDLPNFSFGLGANLTFNAVSVSQDFAVSSVIPETVPI